VAFELLRSVEVNDSYANLELPKLLEEANLDSRDAALAQELAFGTIRNQMFYDKIIERCANRKTSAMDRNSLLLARLGAHQLLNMRIPAHAAINETVNLAKIVVDHGAGGFVNGILRRVSEKDSAAWLNELLPDDVDQIEKLALTNSHPVWIVRALQQALKLDGRESELEALLTADNQPPLVNLALIPGKQADTDEFVSGQASPIGYVMREGDPGKLTQVRDGMMRVQDQGSQLSALLLSKAGPIEQGELWLDLCAGPGGKAAVLAAEAKLAAAHFYANEIAPHRAKLVTQALSKIDPAVEVSCGDGRDFGRDFAGKFDRIMLDAPCTGLGALRRRPEARWRKQPKDVPELSKLQQELLDSAWQALKPGGYLTYVTCSPHSAETVSIVDWLMRKYGSEVELIDAGAVLRKLNPGLKINEKRKTVQLWPQVHDTDAMFMALLSKKAKIG
jgi:16S rRNA (cytosine967-C5)-methyltransferase